MSTPAIQIGHEMICRQDPETRVIPDQSSTFCFVRHGATEPNITGLRCGGDLDLALTKVGREQALETALRIRDMNLGIGVIVCSSLKRTRQHADIVSGVLGGV